jgi:hypothetical protein
MSFPLNSTKAEIAVARALVLTLSAAFALAQCTNLARAAEPSRQIWVRLDSELLAPLIERPVEKQQAVDEVILGVRSLGHARISALPEVTVTDDPDKAAFTVTVTGAIHSQTTGHKGPVQIHSRSITRFTATKRVAFQPGRGFVGEAAEITAQSSCRPERIVPNRGGIVGRVIERRAWSRVSQNRQQVTQIVQAKAEAKIRAAFDELVEERLAKVNRLAEKRYLVGTVLGSPKYVCWTKGGWLNIAVTTERPGEPSSADASGDLAAALEATLRRSAVLGSVGPPVQVWVHEQVLGEPLATLLRRVDRARVLVRQVIAAQAPPHSAVAYVSQPSAGRSYDFSVCGDWIVIHAGDSSRTKLLAMAAAEGENASPAAELLLAQ